LIKFGSVIMFDLLLASSLARRRALRALAVLTSVVLGASQASALPQVHVAPWPAFRLVQAAKPADATAKPRGQGGAEQQAQADQQAPLMELNEVLEATRARLDQLSGATQGVAERRAEIELVRQENERLAGELQRVNGRVAELESSSRRADAEIAHLTNANDVASQNVARLGDELAGARKQNAELEARLAHADSAREAAAATVDKTRAELQQAVESSGAEAERLNNELAAAQGQLGEATTAAAEAERARQLAVSEAQQLRDQTERTNAELVAARDEIDRVSAANSGLERQVASLSAESKAAMDTARQTLVLMEEKMGELGAALAGAGLTATTPSPAPTLNAAAVAAATATPSGRMQAAPQKPGDTGAAGQRADRSGPAAAPAPTADASELARFDANVRYLNSRASEASGADLFAGINSPGDGVVHISTTAAWQKIPPAGQRSYLDSLFDLWTVAKEGNGPTVVQIVDPNGRVLLEKSGTEQDTDRD
jgi:predicted nuclease with TOPRIM domain